MNNFKTIITIMTFMVICSAVTAQSNHSPHKTFKSESVVKNGKVSHRTHIITMNKTHVWIDAKKIDISKCEPVINKKGQLVGMQIRKKYYSSSKMKEKKGF